MGPLSGRPATDSSKPMRLSAAERVDALRSALGVTAIDLESHRVRTDSDTCAVIRKPSGAGCVDHKHRMPCSALAAVFLLANVGLNTSLIPFLEHDDANRAFMGLNMRSRGPQTGE